MRHAGRSRMANRDACENIMLVSFQILQDATRNSDKQEPALVLTYVGQGYPLDLLEYVYHLLFNGIGQSVLQGRVTPDISSTNLARTTWKQGHPYASFSASLHFC